MTRGMKTIKKIFHLSSFVGGLPYVKATFDGLLSTRTADGYMGGQDTAMDNIGQVRRHLQSEYGPMCYRSPRFPWGTNIETYCDIGSGVLATISMPRCAI
eukprot:9477491-Pyramimonas_sp.AAC.1